MSERITPAQWQQIQDRERDQEARITILAAKVERLTARAETAEAERDALRGRIEDALDASALLRGYIEYDSQVAAWMTLESALRGEFPR